MIDYLRMIQVGFYMMLTGLGFLLVSVIIAPMTVWWAPCTILFFGIFLEAYGVIGIHYHNRP